MNHLVLYGPPGTGKTRRLLKLIGNHVAGHPGKVLFCSHTRAAAQEALSRWPQQQANRIDIQTLHSVCFRALKLSKAQTVDDAKLAAFGEEAGFDMSREGIGPSFLEILGLAQARAVEPMVAYDASWRPSTPSMFKAFCESYLQWKAAYGFKDFNDMLVDGALHLTASLLPYSLIAIDEAQDLTPLHWRVIYRMLSLLPRARFVVAGDDDQALYSFAGADPAGMPHFAEAVKAETRVLTQSYRIPYQVHKLAQAIISRVQDRVQKEYHPRTGLDGRPAQGALELWPHMESLKINPERDTLLLYSDRFVRSEVEPLLQEQGLAYKALNGWPSPLDTRAGKAVRVLKLHSDAEIEESDDLRAIVRSGLNGRAQEAWDAVRPRDVLQRVRRDWSMLAMKSDHVDYLRNITGSVAQNLRISTMHGAKGLQADDVHLILSMSPRAWTEYAINPEHTHRLIYTAVTRAKENLYIYDGENAYELPMEYK